jgi:1-acyl-sn-glycerol-3-phosphate acyltransferase
MQNRAWRKIQDWSWLYAVLKVWVSFFHNWIYYRRVIVLNSHKVPKDAHIIFAPNHQNALMDALAVLCTYRGQPVFLARQDLFKRKLIARILHFLKMLPIYRIRDGISTVKNNDAVFLKTIEVIEKKRGLVILPEGNHAAIKRLRLLKKGIARIAFQAEEKSDFTLGIKIVPVGLDFIHYNKFRSTLLVNYGDPIEVSDLAGEYRINPQKAMNHLLQILSVKMKEVMIHIESESYYQTYISLFDIYIKRMKEMFGLHITGHKNRFHAQRKLVKVLDTLQKTKPEVMQQLYLKVKTYSLKLKKAGFRDKILSGQWLSPLQFLLRGIFLIATLPLFLFGWLGNILPIYIANIFANKMKDPVFRATLNFGVSFALFPFYYLFVFAICLLVLEHGYVILLFMLSLPFSGIFSSFYADLAEDYLFRFKLLVITIRNRKAVRNLRNSRLEIIRMLDQWITEARMSGAV